MIFPRTFSSAAMMAILGLWGCSSSAGTVSPPARSDTALARHSRIAHKNAAQIEHIVLIIQENRSFDNLFATFPGADGTTVGTLHTGKVIPLKKRSLAAWDIDHGYNTYLTDYDGGKMDGFDLSRMNGNTPAGKYPYQYVDPSQIQPYWTLAQQYVLADQVFQTQGSGSFTAHQDLIAGGTAINATESLVDDPSTQRWGCNAAPSTTTSLITTSGQYLFDQGPFPCLTYPTGTLRDLLDSQSVSWKYYAPRYRSNTVGVLWNAFAAIDAVKNGPEWRTKISMPETNILNDVTAGKLPMVSWVIPNSQDSDHPWTPRGVDDGPSWVAQVVNAIGGSTYWDSTAIVIVWDDWGGFYDHVPPPFLDNAGGLGFRVPMIVVSPYVSAGTVAHTQYEFGSILKFVEETFGLGSLGTTDVRATSIGNLFNLNQAPIQFAPIPSKRSREYFLHHPPDDRPIDTE
jgi:phospholipase C